MQSSVGEGVFRDMAWSTVGGGVEVQFRIPLVGSESLNHFPACLLVFTSLVQSGFLPPKWATMNCNQSRTNPDIVGTEPDHLGLVFLYKIHCANINHLYLNYHYSEN